MKRTAYRATLFALYQVSIAAGILLMPVALMARQAGVHVPVGRLVETLGDAYESSQQAQDTSQASA